MTSNVKSAKLLKNLAWFIIIINVILFIIALFSLLISSKHTSNGLFSTTSYIVCLIVSFLITIIIPAVLFGIADIINNTHINNLLLSKHFGISISTDEVNDYEKKALSQANEQKKSYVSNCKDCRHDIDDQKCEVYENKPTSMDNYQDGYCHYYIQK